MNPFHLAAPAVALTVAAAPAAQAVTSELRSLTHIAHYVTFQGVQQAQTYYAGNQVFAPNATYTREAVYGWSTGRTDLSIYTASGTGFPTMYLASTGNTYWPGVQPAPARSVHSSDSSFGAYRTAPHSVQMTVWDTPGLDRELHLEWRAAGQNAVGAHVGIDVGADGTWEVFQNIDNQTHQRTIPLQVPAIGRVVVKLEVFGSITNNAGEGDTRTHSASGRVQYRDPPQTSFAFTPYGTACGHGLAGNVVNGLFTRDLSFQVSGGPPFTPGVFLMGFASVNLPIPGTSCSLYVNPAASFPFTTDPTGRMLVTFPSLSNYVAFDVYSQTALLTGGGLTASNGLQARAWFP